MNKVAAFATCSIALLSGCASLSPAEQYAQKLSKILKGYQYQINQQVQNQQKTYRSTANTYLRAQDDNLIESLGHERSERAEKLADSLLQKGIKQPVALSDVRHWLQDYGTYDFSQTQPLLERESEDFTKLVTNLEDLKVETQLIQSLILALDELGNPQSETDRLKAQLVFAERAAAEFKKLECKDVKNMSSKVQVQLEKQTDAKKKEELQNQLNGLKERQCEEGV